jgi:hypothetical protein
MTSAKSGIMCLVLIVLALLSSSQAITIQLNKNNKKVCFYIRGEDVGTDFTLHYGYSGDGYEQVQTTVRCPDFSLRISRKRDIFSQWDQVNKAQ